MTQIFSNYIVESDGNELAYKKSINKKPINSDFDVLFFFLKLPRLKNGGEMSGDLESLYTTKEMRQNRTYNAGTGEWREK
jgi:hypothetical protein